MMKLEQIDRRLDELLAALFSFPRWTKEKKAAQAEWISFMNKHGYKRFPSHYRKCFGLRGVGDQMVLDLPPNRKGFLSAFKGQRTQIFCISSGWFGDRQYAAGMTSKPITHNYADVVKFWLKEKETPKNVGPSENQIIPMKTTGKSIRRGNHTVNDLSTEEAIAKYGKSLIFVGANKPPIDKSKK